MRSLLIFWSSILVLQYVINGLAINVIHAYASTGGMFQHTLVLTALLDLLVLGENTRCIFAVINIWYGKGWCFVKSDLLHLTLSKNAIKYLLCSLLLSQRNLMSHDFNFSAKVICGKMHLMYCYPSFIVLVVISAQKLPGCDIFEL